MHIGLPEYIGTVIRPPSEAASLIFQVTLGCSDNKCTFCPAYKDKSFKVRDIHKLESEMRAAAGVYPGTRKVFLADGDAVIADKDKLKEILLLLAKYFPELTRVSAYGSVKSLETKTVRELAELKQLKLSMIYMGFETGDDQVYKSIKKYGSPQGNLEACLKLKEAGIKTNVTVIAGLGGKKLSKAHAVNTAKILSLARPEQIAVLTLMIAPGTPLFAMRKEGLFEELDEFEILAEIRLLVENLGDFKCQFFANHASNYYPIAARLPKDRDIVIKGLDLILKNHSRDKLVPDFLRGL
jgi:radical SAM superfamily enzyme YgiQ (UPF0313 family)